jgi:nitrate reductase alpha subunit
MDMNYRGVINMLVMCGCVGQSGGGWAHYVGQEKLRPQTGWAPLAFATRLGASAAAAELDLFFYAHTDQWRYETLTSARSSRRPRRRGLGRAAFIDYNIRPSAWAGCRRRRSSRPIRWTGSARQSAGVEPRTMSCELKAGELEMSCMDPDDPNNWPRNMFVWRSNLLGSSGKGHEYFLKHLLGTTTACRARTSARWGRRKPVEVKWHDEAPEGKLDLLVTLDFRMSTTCVYSDIVLPTATWYEKNDLNTSDMHPFIHPLTRRWIRPGSRVSDWEIFKAIAKDISPKSRPRCWASRRTSS